MWKKNILGHISTFCKLWSPTRTKRLKKTKNVFYKCVLEFNFASISGSGFFIFSKKVKIVVPYCTAYRACHPPLIRPPPRTPARAMGFTAHRGDVRDRGQADTEPRHAPSRWWHGVRQACQNKRNLMLISTRCRTLVLSKRVTICYRKTAFLGNCRQKTSFLGNKSLGTSCCKSYAPFWNQRKIALLLIPFADNFKEFFFHRL